MDGAFGKEAKNNDLELWNDCWGSYRDYISHFRRCKGNKDSSSWKPVIDKLSQWN